MSSKIVACSIDTWARSLQLTDSDQSTQLAVDGFCRAQSPAICFIAASTRGLFASVFCDFGASFEVIDATGEEMREFPIAAVTNDPAGGVISTVEHHRHNLEDGDIIKLQGIGGMTELNDIEQTVSVLTPYSFRINTPTARVSHTRT